MTATTHTPPAAAGLVDLREEFPEVWGPDGAHPGEAARLTPMRGALAAVALSGQLPIWDGYARSLENRARATRLPVAERKAAATAAAEYRKLAAKARTVLRQWIDQGTAGLPRGGHRLPPMRPRP